MGDNIARLLSAASEVNCHQTLRWMPFFQCTLAASRRHSANNMFIIYTVQRVSFAGENVREFRVSVVIRESFILDHCDMPSTS